METNKNSNPVKLKKLKIVRIIISIFAILLNISLIWVWYFIYSWYNFIEYKEKIVEKEVIKDKIVENNFLYISDDTKMEYTYQDKKYNKNLLTIYSIVKLTNTKEIFVNTLWYWNNIQKISKNILVDNLVLTYTNKKDIIFEVLSEWKKISLKYDTIMNTDETKITWMDKVIKLLSVNWEDIEIELEITLKDFISFVKKM